MSHFSVASTFVVIYRFSSFSMLIIKRHLATIYLLISSAKDVM